MHIPATAASGFTWPTFLKTLAPGSTVTVQGTQSYADAWSRTNGCPTGGIVATNVVLGNAVPTAAPATPAPTPTPGVPQFTYTAPWGTLAANNSIIVNPHGACQHIPATAASGFAWPAFLKTLAVGTNVTIAGTPSYADAWSKANGCPTGGIVATNIAVGTTVGAPAPTPTPGPVSTPTPTPAPVSTPQPGSYSAALFSSIVNGHEYPANFRPYAATSMFNRGAATSTQNAALTSVLRSNASSLMNGNSGEGAPVSGSGDFSHPSYLASSSDPIVTFTCNQFGCWKDGTQVSSFTAHVPSNAIPTASSDHHFAVIQPNGDTAECWATTHSAGSSNVVGGSCDYVTGGITGDGIAPGVAAVGGGTGLMGGVVYARELRAGVVPHALFLVSQCTSSWIFPAHSNTNQCSGGIPNGAWLHLKMTDAQIAALPSSAGDKILLTALAHYGGFDLDTGGVGNAMGIMHESGTYYTASGAAIPSWPGGNGINWSAIASSMEVLNHP